MLLEEEIRGIVKMKTKFISHYGNTEYKRGSIEPDVLKIRLIIQNIKSKQS
jgi:hypothetical protein